MGTYTGLDKRIKYLFDVIVELLSNIASEYSNTSTYAVGYYVIYSNVLYKCTTAVSTPEDFDATKWTPVMIVDEMGSGGGGGSSTLSGLTDVDINSPANGEALTYDSTNAKWINSLISTRSGSGKYTETSLWSGTATSGMAVTLSDSVENYDIICVEANFSTDHSDIKLIPTSLITLGQSYEFTMGFYHSSSFFADVRFCFPSATSMLMNDTSGTSGYVIRKVIGLKWSNLHEYSTSERVVGTWIDGKPLYEKTIYVASPTSGSYYSHGANNVDYIQITEISVTRNGSWRVGNYYFGNTDYFSCITDVTRLFTQFAMTSCSDMHVTIQYTKTTD